MFEKDKNSKPIIFIDIDDTLADTRAAVHKLYEKSTKLIAGDINTKTKRYSDFCPGWTDEDVNKLFETGYVLYQEVKPLRGAREAVDSLIKKGYDVRLATIHKAEGIPAKQDWVDKYFPMLSKKVYYINSVDNNKDIFREYSIIDDDIRNIKTNESVLPILLDFYNIYPDTASYIKCRTWEQVLTKL